MSATHGVLTERELARRQRLATQIEETRISLLAAGHPDDELLVRLSAAADSARNPGKPSAKPKLPIALRLIQRALELDTLSPAARVLEEKAIVREAAELTKS